MLQAVRVRLLCVLVAAVASSLTLRAEPLRQISTHGYISDFANLLDPASAESLDEVCYRLEYWTGTPLNAITVPSLGGDLSRDYALKVFKEQSEFPESAHRRIVVLFGAKERKFTIIATPEVQAILSGRVRQYRREMVPYLRRHQDGAALAHVTRRIAGDIALDAQVGLKEVRGDDYRALDEWNPVAQPDYVFKECLGAMAVLWSVVIGAIFLVKRFRRGRPKKPALTFLVIENEPLKNLAT